MHVLVVGARELRAGKTTFSLGLTAHADAVGFKPRSGNDCWLHRDRFERAVSEGRLYGKDAALLADASPGERRPEDGNAVHRLWQPAPGPGSGMLGQDDSVFVADRVGGSLVVNDTVALPPLVREHLPVEEAVRVGSLRELNEVTERRHVPTLLALSRRVADHEQAVVESYADVARPLPEFEPDAVAVVEPTRVRVHDGPRFLRACEVATGSPRESRLEERVGSVVDLADPERTCGLAPLTDDERTDPATVARAYEDAYEAVESVAATD